MISSALIGFRVLSCALIRSNDEPSPAVDKGALQRLSLGAAGGEVLRLARVCLRQRPGLWAAVAFLLITASAYSL